MLDKVNTGLFASARLRLNFSNDSAIRIFDNNGHMIYDGAAYLSGSVKHAPLELDIEHPQGPLAGLLGGNVTLWVEGLAANTDFSLTFEQCVPSAHVSPVYASFSTPSANDDVHMDIARYSVIGYYGTEVESVRSLGKQELLDMVAAQASFEDLPIEV